MIRTLILYYLSLKPTHGYEIQKFIQLNHMDSWTKIQSGSIYYALGKLEKEGLILLCKEERVGAKVRKIYSITDAGRQALHASIQEEIVKDIYDIGSDKFILYPVLNGMDKDVLQQCIITHIQTLKVKENETKKWQQLKVGSHTLQVEIICFEMMLSSLAYQIKWHEALLEELDSCICQSKQMSELICKVDFSTINKLSDLLEGYKQDELEQFRKEILENPIDAAAKLDQLIQLIKRD